MGSPTAPASPDRLNMSHRDHGRAAASQSQHAGHGMPAMSGILPDQNRQAAHEGAGPRQGDPHANNNAELPIDTASDLLSGCG
jgi:hypothetical protein